MSLLTMLNAPPLTTLLFSFKGRVNRQIFWLWNAAYYLLILFMTFISHQLMADALPILLPFFWLMLLWPDLAMTTKRWHDRNKSAAWLWLSAPLIVSRFVTPLLTTPAATPASFSSELESGLSTLAVICGFWILIECGLLKGTQGTNQYGDATEIYDADGAEDNDGADNDNNSSMQA